MRLPSASMTELELSTPAEAVLLAITMASTAIPATAARRVKDLYPGRAVLMFVMPIPIQYVLQPIRNSMQSVTIRALDVFVLFRSSRAFRVIHHR